MKNSPKPPLYIIDLDRTLVDVEKVMGVTELVCEELGIDFKKIYKEQQDLYQRGTAYSPFDYIANHPTVDINRFKKRFIELSQGGRLLFNDSRDFLLRLDQEKIDHMILTYGVEDEWQILKINASNLQDIPYLIIKDRHKGRLINNWVREDGQLVPGIPGLGIYDKCVFVDDRPVTFDNFPAEFDGYLLDRSEILSKEAKMSPNIKIIKSLSEIK